MLSWLSEMINQFQPELKFPDDKEAMPPDGYVPLLSDIVISSILMAIILYFIRQLFYRYIVVPFGTYMGVKDKSPKDEILKNPVLEMEYQKSKRPSSKVIESLTKKTSMTERQVEIWFRKRRKQDTVSDMKKLGETSWSFIYYLIISWYGLYVLWDKSWLARTENCWIGWPFQTVSNDIYWYYVTELGYYISYLYMLFTDHKRKDFMEFFVHHLVTVTLLVLSWSYNLVRIGTLVLCLHDQVDYLVSIAKSAAYCKKQNVGGVFFALFLVTWLVTRLFVFPYTILYSVYIELSILADDSRPYLKYLNTSTIGHLTRALLVVLQIIHVIWTTHILKSAATKFTKGKLQDTRSDTEEDDGLYKEEIKKMINGNNNFTV